MCNIICLKYFTHECAKMSKASGELLTLFLKIKKFDLLTANSTERSILLLYTSHLALNPVGHAQSNRLLVVHHLIDILCKHFQCKLLAADSLLYR
jgi:hypothetical protein